MLSVAARLALVALSSSLLACGEGPTTPGSTAAATPRVAAAKQGAPATRPDGVAWERPPARLRDAVDGPVLVAGEAGADLVAGSGCVPSHAAGRFERATIDDFLIHASYRDRAEIAGEPEGPALTGCVATWNESRSQWRKSRSCDPGYTPLSSYRAVAVSGGGLRSCRLSGARLAGIWVVPPRKARWLVAPRAGYSIAYRVKGRFPVHMTFVDPEFDQTMRASFEFDGVTSGGRVRHHVVQGAVAG